MPCWSQRSETGVCSRRWSRRMATFSWAVKRFRVFLGMGAPLLEVVAYSSRRFVPFQLKQNKGVWIVMSRSPASEFKSSAGVVMIRVLAGSFTMGSPESEDGHRVWERHREVTFVNDFYLGK